MNRGGGGLRCSPKYSFRCFQCKKGQLTTFFRLLITFAKGLDPDQAKGLDPDQARHFIVPYLDPVSLAR